MSMINHSQITQSNKFSTSLQYLRKEVRSGHFWYANKHQSFYKLVLSFLMEVARHVFFCDEKYSDILWGSSHVRCYLFLLHLQENFPYAPHASHA